MNKRPRVQNYLAHILSAIERIERYTAELNEAAFLDDDLVQDAVIRNIEIIGEASNKILRADQEFAERHSNIPWQVMYTMRNRVSHGYDTVDLELVWKTVNEDLPRLRAQINELKQGFANDPDEAGAQS